MTLFFPYRPTGGRVTPLGDGASVPPASEAAVLLREFIFATERAGEHYGFGSHEWFAEAQDNLTALAAPG